MNIDKCVFCNSGHCYWDQCCDKCKRCECMNCYGGGCNSCRTALDKKREMIAEVSRLLSENLNGDGLTKTEWSKLKSLKIALKNRK